jgi:uncharacterized phage protein (TIGR02220 family)
VEHDKVDAKPAYYAVIPADVRYDKKVRPMARLLYGEISALANKKGYCYASNRYFAGLYEVDNATISRWIGELKKQGHIYVEMIKSDQGDLFFQERRIYLCMAHRIPHDEKIKGGLIKSSRGVDQKVKHNNTVNNTVNNKDNVELVIAHLNQLTGRGFNPKSKSGLAPLVARLKEYSVQECIQVLDYLHKQWGNDEKMKQYINYQTPFRADKFERYLEESKFTKPKKKLTERERKFREAIGV